MTFIYTLKKVFALMLALIMFIGVGSNGAVSYTVTDEENCRLCIGVISDSHIEGNNLARYNVFGRILKDAKKNSFGNNVEVFLGDNTMNGQDIESFLFYGAVGLVNPADKYVTVIGNHDIGNKEPDQEDAKEGEYDKLFKRFVGWNTSMLGTDIGDKPYYFTVVNGYYFIVLGPEDLCVYDSPMSDAQYEFLDETLALATAGGKPAFVCCHHPEWDTEDISNDEWGSERLRGILESYDNVFYISGHTHFPVCEGWTFDEENGVHYINLPRCTELGGEKDNIPDPDYTGHTVLMEVYDGEVVCRVRNSYTGEWVPELDRTYPLV